MNLAGHTETCILSLEYIKALNFSNRVVSAMYFTHKDCTYAGTLGQPLLQLGRELMFGHVMLIIPSFLVKVV